MDVIRAYVHGSVAFTDPADREREGAFGIVGGEDVTAHRTTFRSPGEAMTWARRVLDKAVRPRWTPAGPIDCPHDDPAWSSARVEYVAPDDDIIAWETDDGRRTWHRVTPDGRRGEVARNDDPLDLGHGEAS